MDEKNKLTVPASGGGSVEMSGERLPEPRDAAFNLMESIDVDRAVEVFTKRTEVLYQFKLIALKCTNSLDWVDMGGKPYLQASGSQKVATVLGVSNRILSFNKTWSEDEKGRFYIYNTVVEVSHPFLGKKEAIGVASQRDDFFAKKGGQYKPSFEIDETSVFKKAQTNGVSRAVCSLLGLSNLSWDEVRSGFKGEIDQRVRYGGDGGSEEKKEKPTDKELNDFENELFLYFGTADNAEQWLVEQTKSFKEIHSVMQVTSKKWLANLKKRLAETRKKDGGKKNLFEDGDE